MNSNLINSWCKTTPTSSQKSEKCSNDIHSKNNFMKSTNSSYTNSGWTHFIIVWPKVNPQFARQKVLGMRQVGSSLSPIHCAFVMTFIMSILKPTVCHNRAAMSPSSKDQIMWIPTEIFDRLEWTQFPCNNSAAALLESDK